MLKKIQFYKCEKFQKKQKLFATFCISPNNRTETPSRIQTFLLVFHPYYQELDMTLIKMLPKSKPNVRVVKIERRKKHHHHHHRL
jgi:hypothetical protein